MCVTIGGDTYHKVIEKKYDYYGSNIRNESICGAANEYYMIQSWEDFEKHAAKAYIRENRNPRRPCKTCFKKGDTVKVEEVYVVVMPDREVLVFRSADAAEKIARATNGDMKKVEVI